MLALAAEPGFAYAQAAPNVDWVSVLRTQNDPRVQITDCGFPDARDPAATVCLDVPSAPQGGGYAETDNVTYGDIVGDGGTEAVVPLDSGGSIGENGSLVYTLDSSGTPQLVIADGPGGAVFIDPKANELVSIEFDPSCSSMNCAAGLIRTGYTLVSDALQQQDTCEYLPSSADQNHPQGTCTPPQSGGAASSTTAQQTTPPAGQPSAPCSNLAQPGDLSCLKAFGGPVLMPPASLQPFAALSWMSAGPACDSRACTPYPGSYEVTFRNPNLEGFKGPEGQINGVMSRKMFDDDVAYLAETYSGCAASAAYCAKNFGPCDGLGCTTLGEVFRGLKTRGTDATVEHLQISGGWNWVVDWFDAKSGVSYRMLDVSDNSLASFDSQGLTANNLAGAQQAAALADKLTVWSGS